MELRLLGPVEIVTAAQTLSPGAPQQRAILAALAMDAGRLVSREVLIDRVWGDSPPARVESGVYAYITRLRKILERASALDADRRATLEREPGGYRLSLPPDGLDLHRFRRFVTTARDRDLPDTERAGLLTQALAQWRGTALTGVPGEWAGRMRDGVNQERLHATVAWARARMALGKPETTFGPLSDLAAEFPLAEPVAAELLRALAAIGRGADALDRYGKLRQRLIEELGAEPGPELQAVHEELLRGERPATVTATTPGADTRGAASTEPPRHRPRQLPVPPQLFTGRALELADLDKLHDASIVVISAIDGMAGVGKTALAVQAAHQMVERYPDGQLFIDLHGYTDGVAPTEPGAALDRMLRALGVPGEGIPASLDERAALYRSRLADQRMLIVLDNAATEDQVTPLLPGAPGCLVLVTSRRRLVGLDHTHTLSVDTLPLHDAVTLFRRSVSDGRLVGQPPDLVPELVESCGRLPLAIRIAAARLRSHPTWDLSELTDRLRDRQRLLVELAAGQRSVTAALDLSYQDLSTDRRSYRLLSLHPGPDIDAYAAAALLDATLPQAGRLLDQLLDAHLLQEPVPGRYRFHDLTRAHAAHTAGRDETQDGRRAAVDRLLDFYRHAASVAMDVAYPYERERRPRVAPARTPIPTLPDPATALDWLDGELGNLLAAARYAAEHDRPGHLLQLSTILHRHLRTRGPHHDAEALHQQALTTARATGDRAAELDALVGLGHIHRLQDRHALATDHYQRALRLARSGGHRAAELDALAGLGHIHAVEGRYDQAADHYQQAVRLARGIAHRSGELDALAGLGVVHRVQGRYEEATDTYQEALRLARATGNDVQLGAALRGLGWVHMRQSRYEEATDQYEQALQLARATGHRIGELGVLNGLGNIHRRQGRHQEATDHYRRLLDLAEETGDRNWQFEAWQGLGRLWYATGRPDAAVTDHGRALALASELGQPDDQARAHDGLAHAHHALHQHEQARAHWQHALDILTRLGVDHTDDEETTVAALQAHLTDPGPI